MKHDYNVTCDAILDLTDEQHERMKAKIIELRIMLAKALQRAHDDVIAPKEAQP